LNTIQTYIVASGGSFNPKQAVATGRLAALEEVASRTDDGINKLVGYGYGPPIPSIYHIVSYGDLP
jgi:hypothetical protein